MNNYKSNPLFYGENAQLVYDNGESVESIAKFNSDDLSFDISIDPSNKVEGL